MINEPGVTRTVGRTGALGLLSGWVRRRLLYLVLAAYAAAALWPGPGLWLRGVSFGEVSLPGERVTLSLPLALLAVLLFVAGLGVRTARLAGLLRNPLPLGAALATNLLLPLALLCGLTRALPLWHNSWEAQDLLLGLALVAAMPVAGSSAAWTQSADGDLSLGLGLVLGSTLLSPLTTPASLRAAALLSPAESAGALHFLAGSGTGGFLLLGAALPSLLAVLAGRAAGPARIDRAGPHLKLAGAGALLLLCYANAAVSLPAVAAEPDWDFLAVLLAVVAGVCLLGFAAGGALARLLKVGPAGRAALVFGLGMSNNGTGLVLAATALGARPRVLLPVILYNLVQHVVAGAVRATLREAPRPAPPGAAG